MSFLELFQKIKNKNEEKICIIRSGIFYYGLKNDAYIMEETCGLEKICFSRNVCKVGFPIASLEKYINMLKENNISYCIYDYLRDRYSKFIDEDTFKYKDKEYGKIKEEVFEGNNNSYTLNCMDCKHYENELMLNVSRLVDSIDKYTAQLEKYNNYKIKLSKDLLV